MKSDNRTWLLLLTLLLGPSLILAEQHTDCTLEPDEGIKQAVLSNSVDAQMTWSACTSLVRDLVFKWPEEKKVPATPTAALKRASNLITEWEKVTKLKVSPFGEVAKMLEKRANEKTIYIYGDDISVSNLDVGGWDGVSVSLSSSTKKIQLAVHYWANP